MRKGWLLIPSDLSGQEHIDPNPRVVHATQHAHSMTDNLLRK